MPIYTIYTDDVIMPRPLATASHDLPQNYERLSRVSAIAKFEDHQSSHLDDMHVYAQT